MKKEVSQLINSNTEYSFLSLISSDIDHTIDYFISKISIYKMCFQDSSVIISFMEDALLKPLARTITNVCALELNSASRRGFLQGSNSQERFNFFCEELKKSEHKEAIFKKYPKLKENIHHIKSLYSGQH